MVNDAIQKLRPPAIGLIVVGSLNGGLAILTLLSGLARLAGVIDPSPTPTERAEKIGYLIGTFAGYGVAALSLLVAPIIIYGAIKMMKGEKIGLAKTAVVLAILPLTSCCFVVGIPLGIWALVVLSKPDVKSFFR